MPRTRSQPHSLIQGWVSIFIMHLTRSRSHHKRYTRLSFYFLLTLGCISTHDVSVALSTRRHCEPVGSRDNERNDQTTNSLPRGDRGAWVKLSGLYQPLRSGLAHNRWRPHRRRQRRCDRGGCWWWTRRRPWRRRRRSGGRCGRPYHYTGAASLPLLTRHACAELRRVYDRW